MAEIIAGSTASFRYHGKPNAEYALLADLMPVITSSAQIGHSGVFLGASHWGAGVAGKIGPSQRSPIARPIARAVRGVSGLPLRVMTRFGARAHRRA